jgi:Glycosyltransferase family 87
MAERAGLRTFIRRLPINRIVAAILALVAGISLAQRLPAVSHRYDQFDFSVFYGWWSDYSSGGDPWTDMRGPMRGCNQPPTFIEIFSPLVRLDRKTAFWIWQAVQFLCVVTAVLLLARGNDPPLGAAPTIIVLSLVLMSRPFAGALVWSQIAPMLLALLSAAWFCARRKRQAAAGLCLALAALLKLFPAGAAGYFLFSRRWRSLGWTVGFFAAGVLLTNPARWIDLATHGLPISYQVVGHAELTVLYVVRKTVTHFAGTRLGARPVIAVWGITALIDLALLAIAAAATITTQARADLDGLVFGLWVALALLMSPLAWIAETLLLVPLFLFGMIAAWEGLQSSEPAGNFGLIAGATTLAICIVTELIKAVPHPGFAMLLAAYLGAALILRTRLRSNSPRPETAKIPG